MLTKYVCEKCNRTLLNATASEIKAHEVSEHGNWDPQKKKVWQLNNHRSQNTVKQPKDRPNIQMILKENKRLKEENARLRKEKPYGFCDQQIWKSTTVKVYARDGRVCAACGRTSGRMHVDHIKPRSKYPELELDMNNLQVLCQNCNEGKSNTFEYDFRKRNELIK